MASHTTDGITYSYDETSGVLEKVEPSSGITSVIVPSSLDGTTIRVIKAFSFYRCAGIEAVTLPSSIMKIESKAFFSCRELSSLTIGDGQHMISLEEVEPYAFAYANALETISVSPTNSMFSASNGMLIKTVGGDCHLVLGRNGAITIPQSISHIDAGAFSFCKEIRNLVIPNTVSHIGAYAFAECSGLLSAILESTIKDIGEGAFCGCSSLMSVSYGAGQLPRWVFGDCQKLNFLRWLASPSDIVSTERVCGEESFYHAESIENVNTGTVENPDISREIAQLFPDVTPTTGNIMVSVQYKTGDTVHATRSVSWGTQYGDPPSVTRVDYELVKWQLYGQDISGGDVCLIAAPHEWQAIWQEKEYTITFILAQNTVLTYSGVSGAEINVPSLADFGYVTEDDFKGWYTAESGGTKYTKATVTIQHSDMTYYGHWVKVRDKWTYEEDLGYPDGLRLFGPRSAYAFAPDSDVVLPEYIEGRRITSIGYDSLPEHFAGNLNIRSLVLPPNLKKIEANAFYGCTNLISVTGNSCLETIESDAFYNCTNLTEFPFPPSLQMIGNSAFQNTMLTALSGLPNLKKIDDYAFYNCSNLQSVSGLSSLEEIGLCGFMDCSNLIVFEFPSTLQKIRQYALSGTSLSSVILPDSVIEIGSWAFQGCNNLKIVEIPPFVQMSSFSISPTSWFSNCFHIETVGVSGGMVTYVGNDLVRDFFQGSLSSIKKVIFGNDVGEIYPMAVYGATSVEEVIFGPNVSSIGRFFIDSTVTSSNIKFVFLGGEPPSIEEGDYPTFPSAVKSKIEIEIPATTEWMESLEEISGKYYWKGLKVSESSVVSQEENPNE